MVDVWTEKDFPDYAQMDWWIPIPLYIIGSICTLVGVYPIAIFMCVLGAVFAFGLKLPIYLIEEYDGNEATNLRLVEGLDILRGRAYYWDILISGPYFGEEVELLRMYLEEVEEC